jgi:hypothetical protein
MMRDPKIALINENNLNLTCHQIAGRFEISEPLDLRIRETSAF